MLNKSNTNILQCITINIFITYFRYANLIYIINKIFMGFVLNYAILFSTFTLLYGFNLQKDISKLELLINKLNKIK